MLAELDVDEQEGRGDEDAQGGDDAQDDVKRQVDALQMTLLQRPVTRWTVTCRHTEQNRFGKLFVKKVTTKENFLEGDNKNTTPKNQTRCC